MAVCQRHVSRLTCHLRGQARSHSLTAFICQCRTALPFCGSWLACDGGVSEACQSADLPPSRASPLPQFDRVHLPVPHCFAFLWELACLRCRQLGVSGTPG